MEKKMLPVGIDAFSKIRDGNYYYVDKTGLARDLLQSGNEVILLTRPRRFGKSLNMDMLKEFFKIGTDSSLFDGLEISKEEELCRKYLGKFPVISISLKDTGGISYKDALARMSRIIKKEARQHQYLLQSNQLSDIDKEELKYLFAGNLTEDIQEGSLYLLSEMLHKHYGRKVIILIDEYDVPLDKAYSNGYYREMTEHIRSMFGEALKTNDNLEFAVLTGCLRISKESIFTGLNNFKICTITDTAYSRYFGFTNNEVMEMLEYYGMGSLYDTVKEWYDGYRFGKTDVYCPWDVINYVSEHLDDIDAPAKMYWINTSGNSIIKKLIKRADSMMKDEIEQLMEGGSINKEVKMELTYKDLDKPEDGRPDINKNNLWSILFITGYLTMKKQPEDGRNYELVIPNKEIHSIFVSQVKEWMEDTIIQDDTSRLLKFCNSVQYGDVAVFEDMFTGYLQDTISIRDINVAKPMKENFYHGLLLGLLRAEGSWRVKSNQESGTGYADIILEICQEKTGCIFEIKYAENGAFDTACRKAMQQIKDNAYIDILKQDGMKVIHQYGIACYKKICKIIYEQYNIQEL